MRLADALRAVHLVTDAEPGCEEDDVVPQTWEFHDLRFHERIRRHRSGVMNEAPPFGIVPEHQEPQWELQSGELALHAVDLRAVAAAGARTGRWSDPVRRIATTRARRARAQAPRGRSREHRRAALTVARKACC